MEKSQVIKIEQNIGTRTELFPEAEYPSLSASVVLQLGGLAMKFARVERAPRYDDETRENDAEHSFMLALIAPELAERLYPGRFDLGLIAQYGVVHDLIELETGDVATFHHSPEDMQKKEHIEHAALDKLLRKLPPHTATLVREYIEQKTPESRFTNGCDKWLPIIVDILGSGKKVMAEDYGVTTPEQLLAGHQKLHSRIAERFKEFPPIVEIHGLLCELFELEFEATQ